MGRRWSANASCSLPRCRVSISTVSLPQLAHAKNLFWPLWLIEKLFWVGQHRFMVYSQRYCLISTANSSVWCILLNTYEATEEWPRFLCGYKKNNRAKKHRLWCIKLINKIISCNCFLHSFCVQMSSISMWYAKESQIWLHICIHIYMSNSILTEGPYIRLAAKFGVMKNFWCWPLHWKLGS